MVEIEPKIFLLENTPSSKPASANTLHLSGVLIGSHTNTKPTKPTPLTISISFITPYDTVYIRDAGVDYFIKGYESTQIIIDYTKQKPTATEDRR